MAWQPFTYVNFLLQQYYFHTSLWSSDQFSNKIFTFIYFFLLNYHPHWSKGVIICIRYEMSWIRGFLGDPQLTSVCMAIYFKIYTFSYLLFIPRNFFSTHASTTKNVIFGVLTLYSLISTNIYFRLFTKIRRHAPSHCACHCPISSLRKLLHHPQIRHNRFHPTSPSLWILRHLNRRPIGSIWESMNHLRFAQRRCYKRGMSLRMWLHQNRCPTGSLRLSIHNIRFTQRMCHLMKVLIINSSPPESWIEGPAD